MNKECKKWLMDHGAGRELIDNMFALHITDIKDMYDRAYAADLVWIVTRGGVMTQRDCVRFALFCVKKIKSKLSDYRSFAVIPALSVWLDNAISETVMQKIFAAAWDAASDFDVIFYNWDAVDEILYADRATAWAAAHAASAAVNAYDIYNIVFTSKAAYDTARNASCSFGDKKNMEEKQAAWIRDTIPFETLNLQ
jgi:hypothetical protein